MTMGGWLQIALLATIVGLLTRPLGGYSGYPLHYQSQLRTTKLG
jgi:hypothetical protein